MRKNFVKNYRKRIGETLRELRFARDYTQQDLADLMDVNRATISKIESGTFALTIDYLAKFAWYLKFDIELVPINEGDIVHGGKWVSEKPTQWASTKPNEAEDDDDEYNDAIFK